MCVAAVFSWVRVSELRGVKGCTYYHILNTHNRVSLKEFAGLNPWNTFISLNENHIKEKLSFLILGHIAKEINRSLQKAYPKFYTLSQLKAFFEHIQIFNFFLIWPRSIICISLCVFTFYTRFKILRLQVAHLTYEIKLILNSIWGTEICRFKKCLGLIG